MNSQQLQDTAALVAITLGLLQIFQIALDDKPSRRRRLELRDLEFQGLLFGDDAEAESLERARLAALEVQKAYASARKVAWDKGKPFPEDEAKWYAAQQVILAAHYREPFWERKEPEPYCPGPDSIAKGQIAYLESGAFSRAKRLRCKVGRRGPILAVYKKAVRAPVVLCYWCKKVTGPGERHVDHKQPLSNGGAHVSGNLCIACIECNLAKCDLSPADFRQLVANKRAANSGTAAEYFRHLQRREA